MTPRKPTRAKALGIDDAEYARLLAAQGGHCALCPNTPKTRRLHVDHDHATGEVRALLCHRCNRALPTWITSEWLRDAADYLDGEKSAPVDVGAALERITQAAEGSVKHVGASGWKSATTKRAGEFPA